MRKLCLGILLLISTASMGQIIPGVVASSIQTQTVYNGLVSGWNFDEASGSLLDHIDSNNGQPTSVTYHATGKINYCYSFLGTSSRVTLGNFFRPTGAFSFSVWTKDGGQPAEKYIICNTIYDTQWRGWRFTRQTDAQASMMLCDGAGNNLDVSFGTAYNNDAWHNTIFTWNGATAYVYIDGVKNAGWSWAHIISYAATHYFTFGANEEATQNYDGEIDGSHIWNRALTDDEAAYVYNDGAGRDL